MPIGNFKDGIYVEIRDYQMKVSGVAKFVKYSIRGKDRNGMFEIPRRYNEFLALRNLLVARWPGYYIPPIPPKKVLGNLE